MDGFRTSRVLVLDNDPEEASYVMRALAQSGIGSIYHTGELVADAPAKLEGIRLLFADMVLENLGATSDDPKICADITTNALLEVLVDERRPIVVVCWTTHHEDLELIEEFRAAFIRKFPKFQVQPLIVFNKPKLREDLTELMRRIAESLGQLEPLTLLFHWEQQVHDAATKTTAELVRLLSPAGGNLREAGYAVLGSLALAERGTRVASEDKEEAIASLFHALNPLILDRLEHLNLRAGAISSESASKLHDAVKAEMQTWAAARKAANLAKDDECFLKRIKKDGLLTVLKDFIGKMPKQPEIKESNIPDQTRAALNAFVHISPTSNDQGVAQPGNVYLWNVDPVTEVERQKHVPCADWTMVAKDTFLRGLPAGSRSVLVEITPVCDFAQDKAAVSRLVAGFLVPQENRAEIPQRALYVWSLGPLHLQEETQKINGEFWIVLNARYFLAASKSVVDTWPVFRRLRTNACSHLVAFVGAHVTRVGMMKIDP